MKKELVINDGTVLATNVEIANNFQKRFFGLMMRKTLSPKNALIISPCNSIHMFFMKFPIDAIFTNKKGEILYLLNSIKPWHISKIVVGAKTVIELPAETLKNNHIKVGDIVKIHEYNDYEEHFYNL